MYKNSNAKTVVLIQSERVLASCHLPPYNAGQPVLVLIGQSASSAVIGGQNR